MGKQICIGINKGTDQLCRNCEADQCLCFATRIVQFLYFLNTKFPASNHLLRLYRPLFRKPHYWFCHEVAHILVIKWLFHGKGNIIIVIPGFGKYVCMTLLTILVWWWRSMFVTSWHNFDNATNGAMWDTLGFLNW